MVNVEAKIAFKIIADRIQCCLPDIIHHNQSGFIKDRFIGETAAFEKCSGLKVNVSKTKAMWIGTMKNSPEKPLGLEWWTTV